MNSVPGDLTEIRDDALVVLGHEDVEAVRTDDQGPDVHVRELLRFDIEVRLPDCQLKFFYLIIFASSHQALFSLFKDRRLVIRCLNHDIAVGLCSELIMRLSYHIHLGYR